MKVYKQLTVIFLIAIMMIAFARSAPELSNGNDDLQIVQDSKANRPEPYNRVHTAGLLWMNTTNMGYFGNPDGYDDPCTGQLAANGEMPGGSGTDFLFVGGLMFGGYLDSVEVDTDGDEVDDATIFQGPLVSTAFEGWTGSGGPDDMPMEMWPMDFVDDPSGAILGRMYETSNVQGRVSCLYEEVYDPGATAEEQFNTMYTDRYVNRGSYTGMDDYDKRDHIPLGIEIKQKTYAWSYDYAQKFIIIDYTLYNRNKDGKDIYDFFMGMYLDCDIGMIGGDWTYNHADDLGGFIQKWAYDVDEATGEEKIADLNLAWAADNDGRNYTGTNWATATEEPGAGKHLDGAKGIVTIRVLRNPNPNLRYAFNMYICDSGDEGNDWGPHWKTGLHAEWDYDLSPKQKGYDDDNRDNLANDKPEPLYNGVTEGRPIADRGKYMVMSNDEFDYAQYEIINVDLGRFSDPYYMEDTPFAQADKWQKWLDPSEELTGGQVHDGTILQRNDLANGADVKYMLSFGPLGVEKFKNIACDYDHDGVADGSIEGKKVWQFKYLDSLKLTMAFIVNDDFHSSLEQNPNYSDPSAIDPEDGIDPALYDKGWRDALTNVIWAERVYDIPMHDTFIKFPDDEEAKSDGWYGEDVGADGIYADTRVTTQCWWASSEYSGPDLGEKDNLLTPFTNSLTDTYGNIATSEDDFLPYGRKEVDQEEVYGVTGDQMRGGTYGYMVKYDKVGGLVPFEDWIRFGFDNGRVDAGDGVPDFTGPPPPPSPKIKISYEGNDVIVKWASKEFYEKDDGTIGYSGPEYFIDPFTNIPDFEGYQIQVSPDLNSLNYAEIFSVDNENYIYENVKEAGDYLDSPISKKEYLDLFIAGSVIINEGDKIYQLVPYGSNRAVAENHRKPGMYEYIVTPVEKIIDETDTINYYEYKFILRDKLYAKETYIAVTSSDFGDPKSGTPPLKSNPSVNGSSAIPTKFLETENVVVVPNPYRGDADYEGLGWEIPEGSDYWSEQDRKIVFLNIPLRSVVRIYTLAGDLVKTIGHNGNARVTERYQYGEYGAAWDLINENNQAVVSGIYLFGVQDVDDDSYQYVGKFVIIK